MGQNTMIRDTKIADDVFKKIEMGWLDQEFTVYGTAYYAQSQMHYKVSNFSDKIYSFIDNAGNSDIFPSNIVRFTQRCPIPAGMKDEKNLQIKIELAKMLQKEYPKELFILLEQIALEVRDDSSYLLLEQQKELLEGTFDGVRLECFRELVKYSYKTLRLSRNYYDVFMKWIDQELKNIEDDFVPQKTSEGKIYAMMYIDNEEEYYIEDALREYIFERKFQLEQNGIITTPLCMQVFWYDYQLPFREARTLYSNRLRNIIRDNYIQQVRKIRATKRCISSLDLNILNDMKGIEKNMGAKAKETLERYLFFWDIKIN